MIDTRLRTVLRHLRRVARPDANAGPSDAALLERFAAGRDEAAFELLVWRHGPIVLSVCRRVLRHEPDAEDAFQATFLALLRKAGSIGKRASVGSWLYKVAHRAALAARAAAARRAAHEQRAARPDLAAEPAGAEWHDLRPLLDEEIGRLPDKYRQPFLLCHLEGKTTDEAARQLGGPRGTVGTRLAWARERLRSRLTQRGVVLGAAAFAALMARELPAAALVQATVRLALSGAAAGPAAALAEGVLRTLFLTRLKTAAALLLAVGLLVAGAGLAAHQLAAAPQPEARQDDAKPDAAGQPPQRADRFGDVLPAGAVARLGTVRFRHEHLVHAVAFAPDGKLLAVAGGPAASVLGVWDAATGREVRRLEGHAGWVLAVAFAPDGKVIASGDQQRQLRAVLVLEQTPTAEARLLLERLAAGAAGARLTQEARAALTRLERRAAAP